MTIRDRFRRARSLCPGTLPPLAAALLIGAAPAVAQLTTAGSQIFQQGVGGVPGVADGDERFGSALAAGDFNGDGKDDLAIGAPREAIGAASEAGLLTAIHAGGGGLDGALSGDWYLQLVLAEFADDGDYLGAALAAGDFDADGYDDLAIGIPGRRVQRADLSFHDAAGAVLVLRGSVGGINNGGFLHVHQETPGIEGLAEASDRFGSALAVGDFDDDGYDDLAIGVPYESVGATQGAGAVNVLYGSAAGLAPAGDQIWTQGEIIGSGDDEAGDHFGAALAAGDFDGDGDDDLAIGTPDENYGSVEDAGLVLQLAGGAGGLADTSGAADVVQDSIDFGASEPSDRGVNPCRYDPKYREFDFWIGTRDVVPNGAPPGTPASEKVVTLEHGDCIVHEDWKGTSGVTGESFNLWDASRGAWFQTWVDSTGGMHEYRGGLDDKGSMTFTAELAPGPGQPANERGRVPTRLTFFRLDPNRVRQLSEQSTDGGETWSVAYDLIYTRRKE